jgi:hypothetical protein
VQNRLIEIQYYAYGGLATPLAMIGYPIAIWLIPFYSEVVGIDLFM